MDLDWYRSIGYRLSLKEKAVTSYDGPYSVILVKRAGGGRVIQTLETGFDGSYDDCQAAVEEHSCPVGYEPVIKYMGSYDDPPGSPPYLANQKDWLIGEHGTLERPFGPL